MILSLIRNGCRIGFFGLGISNTALLCHLPLNKCSVTVRSDSTICPSEIPEWINVERILVGENACLDIDEDILFFSPSVRRDRAEFSEARRRGVLFSSDAELFFEENRKPIYAVTGSDGKSTTATLINLLLRTGGHKSVAVGNIGDPMICHLESDADCFVAELSSFMLEYCCPASRAACITNLTPNHLDWHGSLEAYKKTKLSIASGAERLIISDDTLEIKGAYGIISTRLDYQSLKEMYDARLYITASDGYILRNCERVISLKDIAISGEHNIKNLMMAIAMTDGTVGPEAISRVARSFKGLPHRCQTVLCKDGVNYIDSSIDSTPARTSQTLKSLNRPVVIILGGRGKGLDYRDLIPAVKEYVSRAIVIGDNANEIRDAIKGYTDIHLASSLEEATKLGIEYARNVGVLLLSPASTSYGMFKSYAERGEKFKEILQNNA